ncbi:hypothetical protein NDU88_000886 [Pleurodeles waltl]|uniref:Uncharacterized protein n=1 Tax=Pleurodeles waltl TaxID=8319 RepID=A0AAV7TI29_PLEWA|nr:hypothetical protein NDU88_000886 [Pleurodeles waltl]
MALGPAVFFLQDHRKLVRCWLTAPCPAQTDPLMSKSDNKSHAHYIEIFAMIDDALVVMATVRVVITSGSNVPVNEECTNKLAFGITPTKGLEAATSQLGGRARDRGLSSSVSPCRRLRTCVGDHIDDRPEAGSRVRLLSEPFAALLPLVPAFVFRPPHPLWTLRAGGSAAGFTSTTAAGRLAWTGAAGLVPVSTTAPVVGPEVGPRGFRPGWGGQEWLHTLAHASAAISTSGPETGPRARLLLGPLATLPPLIPVSGLRPPHPPWMLCAGCRAAGFTSTTAAGRLAWMSTAVLVPVLINAPAASPEVVPR